MKSLLALCLIFFSNLAFSQHKTASFASIDWKARNIDADSPDSLSKLLTTPYTTDLEKVRSIFSWITAHISYNVARFQTRPVIYHDDGVESADDTCSVLKPLDLRVANIVLKRRVTVCEGYARLFKTLCEFANIKSEIISGYSRTNTSSSRQFRCNHKWNAVRIDSNWHLLDVTWASGYLSFAGDEFIKDYNDYYFLTPPKYFISDHYPEDIRWTLLENPPTLSEFNRTPFKQTAFSPYKIISYSPSKGIINATLGDTIKIEIETNDRKKNLCVLDMPSPDSTTIAVADSIAHANRQYVVDGNKVSFDYVVTSEDAEWLQVIYNGNMVLRYKLRVKKEPLEFPPITIRDITGTN